MPPITPSQKAAKHAEAFRQAEGSVRLEGIDPADFPLYNALKARVLSGEMTSKEASALLRAEFTNSQQSAA